MSEGPSKNELKKMAKKAEKAAKKAAAKAGGAAPAQQQGAKPAAAAAAPTAAAAVALPSPPKVLLYQGAKDDSATLKVVLASQYYKIPVGVAKKKDLPVGCPASTKKSILVYGSGDYVLGGGGNAMVKAIALMAGEGLSFVADEWCEIERNTLRNAKAPKLDALATALENSPTGIHLVGDVDTCADISILVTLSKHEASIATWPAAVQKYYKCHSAALDRARASIGDFCPAPAIDILTNPSLTKVLTSIFAEIVEEIAPDFTLPKSIVKKCESPKHGDYQCSVTMAAFANLKKSGKMPAGINAPPQLAQLIIDKVGKGHPVIEEMRIQGPGFIMCKISASYLEGHIKTIMSNQSLPKPVNEGPQQTCLVDFSSPNIASKFESCFLEKVMLSRFVPILTFVIVLPLLDCRGDARWTLAFHYYWRVRLSYFGVCWKQSGANQSRW